jgi:hypothetical protein
VNTGVGVGVSVAAAAGQSARVEAAEVYVELHPLQPPRDLGDVRRVRDRGVTRLAALTCLAEPLAERRKHRVRRRRGPVRGASQVDLRHRDEVLRLLAEVRLQPRYSLARDTIPSALTFSRWARLQCCRITSPLVLTAVQPPTLQLQSSWTPRPSIRVCP